MKNKITEDDIRKALDVVLTIAMGSGAHKWSKSITFNPASLKYRVRFYNFDGSGKERKYEYKNPADAMKEYNSFEV